MGNCSSVACSSIGCGNCSPSCLHPHTIFGAAPAPSYNAVYKIALKIPGSVGYLYYDPKSRKFKHEININSWLEGLYMPNPTATSTAGDWTGWIVYNDELPNYSEISAESTGTTTRHSTTAGHCKGILAWNKTEMAWLIHSVPKFPANFDGRTLQPINNSQSIYGQSFAYIRIHFGNIRQDIWLQELLEHIAIMKPNIYIKHGLDKSIFENIFDHHCLPSDKTNLQVWQWGNIFKHYAKSPHLDADFYDKLTSKEGACIVESWVRGHELADSATVHKNMAVTFVQPHSYPSFEGECNLDLGLAQEIKYSEHQDHSKWAVSKYAVNPWVLVGDMNRMASQAKRGGGGLVIYDHKLREAWLALLLPTATPLSTYKVQNI